MRTPPSDTDRTFDQLSRLLAEDPVLRIDEFEGCFALSSRSRLFRRIVEQGYYEPDLTRRCLELLDPSRDVIDVGANVGFHTVLFARRLQAGRLLAVEPTRNALGRLHRNIALNGVEHKVTVFEGVASNVPGSVEIKTIAGLEEFSSLGAMEHPSISGSEYKAETVAANTIDALVKQYGLKPGFIKVDVEGVEHLVFEGARRTLEEHRPVVISELSNYLLKKNGSSASAIVRVFERLGYEISDPLHPGVAPGHRDFGDMVCVPR